MIKETFLKEYNRLNEKQREAVDTIKGPVMVIAGPGTGKTQILAMRIANILRETEVDPNNILALTFTNSGVLAMRKRLLQIIGPSSYKVNIHTFHSFCNEVIQTFPEKFLFGRTLEQINDLDQILTIKKILDQNDFTKIKTLKAPYYYQTAILQSISSLKQENIRPEEFKKIVNKELQALELIDDLYNDKGPNKGKMKAKYIDQKEQFIKNLELAEAYKDYEAALKENGLYDYADMILFVVKAFENDSELINYYQEKYQYILVDEYQDTNSAQNEVVRHLSSLYEKPNLFVVGDDEQSIYRFQGAALENILEFVNLHPDAHKIVLEENYRSGQKILDASRQVISNNQKQIFNVLNIEKKLQSKTNFDSKIHLAHLNSNQVEDFFISQTIKKLLENNIEPTEIACIYKEHRDGAELADFLAKSKIPFSQNNSDNIFLDADIQKILKLLKIVNKPNSELIFEVLHYPFLNLEKIDVYQLTNYASKHKKFIFDCMASPTENKWKNKKSIDEFVKLILDAGSDFANLTFAAAFELLVNNSGFIKYLLNLSDAPIKLNKLKSMFDEIKTLNTKQKDLRLANFIQYTEQLEENNLKIAERPMETDFHGVKLLTAHQSKGLEFKYVFIIHLTDNHWGNKSARKLIKLPNGLMKIQDSVEDADEEERRLFYVALTRAKKEIFLSYADRYNDSSSNTMPSKFLAEINPEFISIINEKEFEEKYTERLETSLSPIALAPNKDIKKYMAELAQKFVLSVTSFNTYLDCPQKFFYNQFLHVPKLKDFTIAYGSSVHYALELFFKKQINDSVLPDKNYLFDCFKEGLAKEILTDVDNKRAVHLGIKILDEYFDFYENDWTTKTPVACEYNFGPHNIHFGDIAITGKIDKIELIDETSKKVRIIDYKTSSAKSQNYLLGQTKEADLDFVHQAYFYKLLAENDSDFDWQIAEIEFDFVSPTNGKFSKVTIPIDPEAYQNFIEQVKEVHKNILELKFMPDKTACKSSRFECDYIDLC